MVRSSGQQKCALLFCGITLIVLGAGITASGFIYEFLDPYDKVSAKERPGFSLHSQYWLGIPLLLFGMYVLASSSSRASILYLSGLVMASLLMVVSICGVILEGPRWSGWIRLALLAEDYSKGGCARAFGDLPLTCKQVRYAMVINTVTVVFSAMAILVCQFCCFVYVRVLGLLLHIRYDDPIDDYYAKAYGSHYMNGHHGMGIGGHARANQVALSTINP